LRNFQAFPKPEIKGTEQESIIPLEQVEKQAILHAIDVLKGDKLQAARRLGIGKTTLYRKLKEYGSAV
jgi:transcriptional regulator of acetoin/glycerol metabolism